MAVKLIIDRKRN